MSVHRLMPFGKYKDQPISEILEEDLEYLEWLIEQPWMGESHPDLLEYIEGLIEEEIL
jgi:uncharacterized protein (DUF3820 family)